MASPTSIYRAAHNVDPRCERLWPFLNRRH
jgi:hypothetical protein